MQTRIATNTFTNNLKDRVQSLNWQQYNLLQQASSGQRIEYPSDDPVSVGRVLQLRSEKSSIAQYTRNSDRAESVLKATHSTLTRVNNLVSRAQELSMLSGSGVNANDIGPYSKEVDELVEQVVALLNSKYLGEYLFAGTKTESTVSVYSVTRDPTTNKITAITYNGSKPSDSDYREADFYIAESTKIKPFNSGTNNVSLAAIVTNLISLSQAMDAQDTVTIRAQTQNLITDGNIVIGMLGNSASKLTSIDVSKAQNGERFSSDDQQISLEADVDFAQLIISLQQAQNAFQAALQTGSKVLNISLLDYI